MCKLIKGVLAAKMLFAASCNYVLLRSVIFLDSYFGGGAVVAIGFNEAISKFWDALVLRVWETPSSTLPLSLSQSRTHCHSRTVTLEQSL